jgi:hypothetical protein
MTDTYNHTIVRRLGPAQSSTNSDAPAIRNRPQPSWVYRVEPGALEHDSKKIEYEN